MTRRKAISIIAGWNSPVLFGRQFLELSGVTSGAQPVVRDTSVDAATARRMSVDDNPPKHDSSSKSPGIWEPRGVLSLTSEPTRARHSGLSVIIGRVGFDLGSR